MATRNHRADTAVKQILDILRREYVPTHPRAKVEAYRYYPERIWIRILDPGFAGIDLTERTGPIWKILHKNLPEKVSLQIGLLLCLAPRETKKSAMNMEFEDPHPVES